MTLNCIAIDDEPLALQLIGGYARNLPVLKLVQTFEDAIAGAEFLRTNLIDLLFIDINMPDITGIELVRSLEQKPMVIFTTAYKNFAYEGFELEAIDYLLKPIDFNRFSRAVDKAVEYYNYKTSAKQEEDQDSIYVYSEYRIIRINVSSIEYLESMEDYVKIHIDAPKPILTLMPLKTMLEKLPADKFMRIHRSYAVALNKIRSIQNKRIELSTTTLPVSDSYIDAVRRYVKFR